MIRPVRLQRARRKGFDLQAWSHEINSLDAINCARPTTLGNPFTMKGCREAGYVGTDKQIAQRCVNAFDAWLTSNLWRMNWDGPEAERTRSAILASLPTLRGKNLACWCGLCARHAATGKPLDEPCPDCAPCHIDPLGELANAPICEAAP